MRVLNSYEFKETTQRTGKHDWNMLTDGAIRELKQGEDFMGKKKFFAISCRLKAKKLGLQVRLSGHNDESTPTLIVQFVKPGAVVQQPPVTTPAKKGKK
jgi:hypothetical protein